MIHARVTEIEWTKLVIFMKLGVKWILSVCRILAADKCVRTLINFHFGISARKKYTTNQPKLNVHSYKNPCDNFFYSYLVLFVFLGLLYCEHSSIPVFLLSLKFTNAVFFAVALMSSTKAHETQCQRWYHRSLLGSAVWNLDSFQCDLFILIASVPFSLSFSLSFSRIVVPTMNRFLFISTNKTIIMHNKHSVIMRAKIIRSIAI